MGGQHAYISPVPVTEQSGEAAFRFGKHTGRTIREIALAYPDYLSWMRGQDFSPAVKDIIVNALRGEFPQLH